MKTPQIPMTVLALEQSRPMPAGTWILLAVFFALFVWAVFYLRQKKSEIRQKEILADCTFAYIVHPCQPYRNKS